MEFKKSNSNSIPCPTNDCEVCLAVHQYCTRHDSRVAFSQPVVTKEFCVGNVCELAVYIISVIMFISLVY